MFSTGVCVCLQCTFSHACVISAAQGFAPCSGLSLQSVTMPTTPGPVRTHHSPTCFKMALSYVAEPPALTELPDNHSAPQLHPLTPAGQLYSESQRVQLQGSWGHSCKQKTHLAISTLQLSSDTFFNVISTSQLSSDTFFNVVVAGARVRWEECVGGDGFRE